MEDAVDSEPFKVSTSIEDDDVVVLRMHGELDMSSAETLVASVSAALAKSPREIVANVAEVDFMDSSGLRALLKAQEMAAASEVGFCLTGVSGSARRVLEITGTLERLRHR